jgi:shikimate dehydrogenase
MVRALADHGVGATKPAGPALILGAGATACAALAALCDLCEHSVDVAVRDPDRAAALFAAAERLGVAVQLRHFDAASLAGARLIISTVPAAAADGIARELAALPTRPEAVFDVSYHPWPSALGRAAQQAGAVVIDGFELLLQQAALQVELMTGRPPPRDEMRAAGRAELRRRAQIIGQAPR